MDICLKYETHSYVKYIICDICSQHFSCSRFVIFLLVLIVQLFVECLIKPLILKQIYFSLIQTIPWFYFHCNVHVLHLIVPGNHLMLALVINSNGLRRFGPFSIQQVCCKHQRIRFKAPNVPKEKSFVFERKKRSVSYFIFFPFGAFPVDWTPGLKIWFQ